MIIRRPGNTGSEVLNGNNEPPEEHGHWSGLRLIQVCFGSAWTLDNTCTRSAQETSPGTQMPHTPGDAVLCSAQMGKEAPCLGHQNTYIGDPTKPRSAGPMYQEEGKTDEEKLERWKLSQAAAGRNSDLTKKAIVR